MAIVFNVTKFSISIRVCYRILSYYRVYVYAIVRLHYIVICKTLNFTLQYSQAFWFWRHLFLPFLCTTRSSWRVCGWIVRIVMMCRKNICESSAFLYFFALSDFSTPEKRAKSSSHFIINSLFFFFAPYKTNAKRSLETCEFGLIPKMFYYSISIHCNVCGAEYNIIQMNKCSTK